MNRLVIELLAFVGLLLVGVAYLVWLDIGCDLQGVLTLQGKVCI